MSVCNLVVNLYIKLNYFFILPIEQPAENKHRFRYKSEGRATGTLLGENSTDEIKTYPRLQIRGYQVLLILKTYY